MIIRFAKRLAFFSVLILAQPSAFLAAEQGGGPSAQVFPFFANACKPGMPVPVAVDLENTNSSAKCAIEAWVGRRTHGRSVVCKIFRKPTGRQRVWLYPLADYSQDSSLVVKLNGIELARILLEPSARVVMPLPGIPPDRFAVAGAVDAFSLSLPQAFFPGEDPTVPLQKNTLATPELCWAGMAFYGNGNFPAQHFQKNGFRLVNINSPEILPDRWYGFQALDVIVWDAGFNIPLSEIQRRAILQWIQSGGRFVVIGPESNARTCAPLPELMPGPDQDSDAGLGDMPGIRVLDRHVGIGLVRMAVCETDSLLGLDERALTVLADMPRHVISATSYGKSEELATLELLLGRALSSTRRLLKKICLLLVGYGFILSVSIYALPRMMPSIKWILIAIPASVLFLALAIFHFVWWPGLQGRVEACLEIRDVGLDGSGIVTRAIRARQPGWREWRLKQKPLSTLFLMPVPKANPLMLQEEIQLKETDCSDSAKRVVVAGTPGLERMLLEAQPFDAEQPFFKSNLVLAKDCLTGSITLPPNVSYTNMFILYGNTLIGVARNGALSNDTRQIEDLMRVPGQWQLALPSPDETFLDSMTAWVEIASETALCASGRSGWEGVRSGVLPNDFMGRWNAPKNQAVFFAFRETTDRWGALRKVVCVRHIMPVRLEGALQE